MSRYGYLACHDCEVILWLGKARFAGDRVVAFHAGADATPNPENTLLTRALWKFLATHAGHPIATQVEGAPDFDKIAEYREIGGDMEGDVSLEEYVSDPP